jgi:STE24 endopeptidase
MNTFRWLILVSVLSLAFNVNGQSTNQPSFDVEKATRAYLDRMTPEQKAKSDAYFEGGYWLQLWDFLYLVAVTALLLQGKVSARMRDLAERCTRFKPVHTAVYAAQYFVLTAVLTGPIDVYAGYFREHQYGMSNQDLGGWLGDWGKGVMVGATAGTLLLVPLFGTVRRLPRTWHLWGAMVAVVFLIIGALVSPVFIAPLFNKYTVLRDAKVVDPILRLARANGIPADNVYEMDASKQTKRVSANVSGFLGTTRITLNDNLINRSTLPEIEAVMGHEMGHYVMNHVFKDILFFMIIIMVGFALVRWTLDRSLAAFGPRWGINGITDVAVVPVAVFIFSAYTFVLTPFTNSFIRMQEQEADMFGLNAARQPDGFAEAALKLGEYRKMEPGPIEEFIFFDHPSGATRIRCAMRWKAANLP